MSIQLLGTFLASIIVDRLGRRVLMIGSSFGASGLYAIMAIFTFMTTKGYDLSTLNWIPVVTLSIALFSLAMGIVPLSFVIMTEILPIKVNLL